MPPENTSVLTRASFYEAGITRPPAGPPLSGRITVDVCVVGGGHGGLSAALELAERGYSVALLEAGRIGGGASSRHDGQALIGFGAEAERAIEAQMPAAEARRAWAVSLAGMQLLRQRIARHALDCDFVAGHLSLAVNARKAKALEGRVKHLETYYGHEMQFIPVAGISQCIASRRFHAGAYDPQSGHLHPLKFCLGLAAAARDAGVSIFEHSTVKKLFHGDKPVVDTSTGNVFCDFVVLTGNVHLGKYRKSNASPGQRIAPQLAPRIMPFGSCMIATECMPQERADQLIRQRAAACDTNHLFDCFRPTADHRLIFGAGTIGQAAAGSDMAARTRQRMLAVFPQLADLEVRYVWDGCVDITRNRAPDFGRLGNNVYYLQGFSAHGMAIAGIAGKLVAEALAGQAERFDLLARIRHRDFPGGSLLRTPVMALGMLFHRLQDML